MHPLLKAFIDIALRRQGPEQLPASGFLLGIAAATFFLADLSGYLLSDLQLQQIVSLSLIGPLYLAAFTVLVLRIHQQRVRTVQTLSALFGVGAIFNLAQVALAVVASSLPEHEDLNLMVSVAWLAIVVLNVSAFGYILQRALDRDTVSGVVLSLIYFVTFFSMANAVLTA
jgi:hypothetical protein